MFPDPAYLKGSKGFKSLVHWYSNFFLPKSPKTILYAFTALGYSLCIDPVPSKSVMGKDCTFYTSGAR